MRYLTKRHATPPARNFSAWLALVLATPQAQAQQAPDQGPQPVKSGYVKSIVDGDTLVLRSGTQVRLVGIQAPKLPLGRRNFKSWPLAKKAKDALARLALGKTLTLSYGGKRSDRHRRLLAHLFAGKVWIQGELLRSGMARMYSFPDNRARIKDMLTLERSARTSRRGIWANRFYAIRDIAETGRHIGTFQLIEGRVLNATIVRGRAYLNFGKDWRSDFTITISPRWMRRRWGKGPAIGDYVNRRVRVRGWLKSYNGPMIDATHPEQIELLP